MSSNSVAKERCLSFSLEGGSNRVSLDRCNNDATEERGLDSSLGEVNTVTIRISDKSGIEMVQMCPVVEWS